MYRKGLLHHHHCSLPACLPVPFTNAYNRPTTTSFPFFSLFFFLSVGVSVIFISIFIAVYIPSSSSSSSIALYQWQYYCVHRFLSMFIYAAWRPSFFFWETALDPWAYERTSERIREYVVHYNCVHIHAVYRILQTAETHHRQLDSTGRRLHISSCAVPSLRTPCRTSSSQQSFKSISNIMDNQFLALYALINSHLKLRLQRWCTVHSSYYSAYFAKSPPPSPRRDP